MVLLACLREVIIKVYPHFYSWITSFVKVCGQKILFVLVLGHGIQSDLRVRHCLVQKLLFQRHIKHKPDLALDSYFHHITLWSYEISRETHHIEAIKILNGIFVLPLHFFALLCVVELLELLKRRFLFPVESSDILHGSSMCKFPWVILDPII